MTVKSADLRIPEVLEEMLSQATEILVRKYGARLIVFHGSRHFGDPYPDSDIDLLVVKDTDDQDPQKRAGEAEALLAGIGAPVPFDVQVWTPDEVRWGLSEGQTYVGVAFFNGKFLYGKGTDSMTAKDYFFDIRFWLEEARRHFDQGNMSLEREYEIGAMDELFQSTERYLKAFLLTKNIRVEMTHSLSGLLDQAVKYQPSWESLRKTLEVAYEWGRACHYPPRSPGEVRIVPTLAEVKELYDKLDPWLKTLDRNLELSIETQEKSRKKDHGLGL